MKKTGLFFFVISALWIFAAPAAGAKTNCDGQAKPALLCPTGYSMMCIPVGGDHWGCGKESNGSITEISSGGDISVSSSNSSSVKTEVSAEASTGGNSASNGGTVSTGNSKSSVSVKNSNSSDSSDDATEIEIEVEHGVSSVKIENSSSGTSTSSGESVKVRSSSSDSSSQSSDDSDDDGEDGVEIELEEEHGQFFLKVNGEEIRVPDESGNLKVTVRGWDPKEKKITITPGEVRTGSDLENFVRVLALRDDRIENISIATTSIELGYSHEARLFGLFSYKLTPIVTVQGGAGSTTDIKVKFPWYHFFFKKGIDFSEVEREFELTQTEISATENDMNRIAATLQTLSNILKTKHDTAKNSIGNIR